MMVEVEVEVRLMGSGCGGDWWPGGDEVICCPIRGTPSAKSQIKSFHDSVRHLQVGRHLKSRLCGVYRHENRILSGSRCYSMNKHIARFSSRFVDRLNFFCRMKKCARRWSTHVHCDGCACNRHNIVLGMTTSLYTFRQRKHKAERKTWFDDNEFSRLRKKASFVCRTTLKGKYSTAKSHSVDWTS